MINHILTRYLIYTKLALKIASVSGICHSSGGFARYSLIFQLAFRLTSQKELSDGKN